MSDSKEIDYQAEVKKVHPDSRIKRLYGWEEYDYNCIVVTGTSTIVELSRITLSENSAWESAYNKIYNH